MVPERVSSQGSGFLGAGVQAFRALGVRWEGLQGFRTQDLG